MGSSATMNDRPVNNLFLEPISILSRYERQVQKFDLHNYLYKKQRKTYFTNKTSRSCFKDSLNNIRLCLLIKDDYCDIHALLGP